MYEGLMLTSQNDVDFMIHGLFSYNLFGQELWITTSHVYLLIVVISLIIFFIVGGQVFRKADKIPGVFQNILELPVHVRL